MKLPTLNKQRLSVGLQFYLAIAIFVLMEILSGSLQHGAASHPGVWLGFISFVLAGPAYIVFVYAPDRTKSR